MKLNFTPVSLETLKETKKLEVDRLIGEIRSRYITTIPGQEMVYQVKEQEARGVLDGTYTNPPHIMAEAQSTNQDPVEIARLVLQKANEWRQLSAQLEALRVSTKRAIEESTSHAEVLSVSKVVWE